MKERIKIISEAINNDINLSNEYEEDDFDTLINKAV
jgi:hypothetical protein